MKKPNIILLLIDSLRADKFSGPKKSSITPNLDKMFKNGTYFDQAISSSDATLMVWASMFTAKHAIKTGLKSDRYNKLDDSIVNYLEIFQKGGYHIYSHLPYLATTIGLFPEFENKDWVKFSGKDSSGKDLSDGLGNQIINFLDSNSMKNPWFYYAHINDLHYPIDVPTKFLDKKYGLTKYDQQVSSIDEWIGKFLKVIDLENTIIVLMADHGIFIPTINNNGNPISFETDSKKQQKITSVTKRIPKFLNPIKTNLFFTLEKQQTKKKISMIEKLNLKPHEKRNLLWHRSDLDKVLYDDNVHVPLLFYGVNMKSKIISQQVGLIDLMPTICELIGIEDIVINKNGKSFVNLLQGKTMKELPVFLETSQLVQKKSNMGIGVRTSHYKYFRDFDDPTKRIHLYDLKNDPNEDENIAIDNPNILTEMENILQNLLIDSPTSNDEFNEEETKIIEDELKRLGYM